MLECRHIAGLHQLSMGLLRRGASSMSLSTLPFDYLTHHQPLPQPSPEFAGHDAVPIIRSQSADYEDYFDTASEMEEPVSISISFQVFFICS